jgi:serine O-acetyltransferase
MSEIHFQDMFGLNLKQLLDADWKRFHEFGGSISPPRRFQDNFSPRFVHIFLLRVAQRMWAKGHRRTAKLFSLANVVLFGLEVPARLSIGPGLVIPHANGIIIGAGFVDRNVTIFQQVTLGAKLVDFEYNPKLRPHVEEGVSITAGAKILGGVRIGSHSVIGANAVVLTDIPPRSVAVGIPATFKPVKLEK